MIACHEVNDTQHCDGTTALAWHSVQNVLDTNMCTCIYLLICISLYVQTRTRIHVYSSRHRICRKISQRTITTASGSKNYKSLLQESPTKETIFCKRDYNICVAAHMSHALQMCRYNRTKKIFEQTNVLSVYTFGWNNTNIRKGARYKSKSL